MKILMNLMFNVFKNYMASTMIYHFYLKEGKLKRLKDVCSTCMIKKNISYINKKFKRSAKSWISIENRPKFIQKYWLKSAIDMNKELRKNSKSDLKNIFLN